MLEQAEWGEFMLGDLLEFKAIKQAKSQKEIPTDDGPNGVPYIVQSTFNNMFSRNVSREWLIEHNEPPVSGNKIVLGVTLPAVSYQPKEFGASQVITATAKRMNRYNGVFIASIISILMKQFSYEKKPGLQIYKEMKIRLPTKYGNIDFDFMDKFIAKLESKHLTQLETYLKITGLKDYELTDSELTAIDDLKQNRIRFKKFYIGDLYDVLPTENKLFKKDIVEDGTVPIFSSDSTNNGILGYCNKTPSYIVDENHPYYVVFGDHTRTTNIAKENFCIADNVKVLSPKTKNINAILYINTAWKKTIPNLGYARHWTLAKATEIDIPVKDEEIDYDFMSCYISAVKKLAIKDFVLFADQEIQATKDVINK